MKVESISSNAWVDEPSTSASILIQLISYTKDARPVKQATIMRSVVPVASCSGRASIAGVHNGRASNQTIAASARLSTPATRSVPGNPTHWINTKPLTNTPTAAPRLLVKYSIATDSPVLAGWLRTSPALISGNVMPSSSDCGRISVAESASFTPSTRPSPASSDPSPGKTDA